MLEIASEPLKLEVGDRLKSWWMGGWAAGGALDRNSFLLQFFKTYHTYTLHTLHYTCNIVTKITMDLPRVPCKQPVSCYRLCTMHVITIWQVGYMHYETTTVGLLTFFVRVLKMYLPSLYNCSLQLYQYIFLCFLCVYFISEDLVMPLETLS